MRRALLLAIVLAGCTPALATVETPLPRAAPSSTSTTATTTPPAPPPPSHCDDYDAMERGEGHPENQRWFNALPASHGDKGYTRTHVACVYRWGAAEWAALDEIWQLEADGGDDSNGHDWHRENAPQAKPESKLQTQGGCDAADERCEVRWGARYIAGRYGTPSAALRAWRSRSPHWY